VAKHGVIAKLKKLVQGERKQGHGGASHRHGAHRRHSPVRCPDGRWRRFERPETCRRCGARHSLRYAGRQTYRCRSCGKSMTWSAGDVEW